MNKQQAQRVAWPVVVSAILIAALQSKFNETEGFRTDPYYDTAGVLTVCRGMTNAVAVPILGRRIVLGERWSEQECADGETRVLIEFSRIMRACTDAAPLFWWELFAWLHFGWNIGPDNFCASTAARRLRERRYDEACDQILMWKRSGGRDCSVRNNGCYGLWVRRKLEHAVCAGQVEIPGLAPIPLMLGGDRDDGQ